MSGFKYVHNRRILYNEESNPSNPIKTFNPEDYTYYPVETDIYNACITANVPFETAIPDFSLTLPKISRLKSRPDLSLRTLSHIFRKNIVVYTLAFKIESVEILDFPETIYLYTEKDACYDILLPVPLRKFQMQCFPLYALIVKYGGPIYTVANKTYFADLFLTETSVTDRANFAEELKELKAAGTLAEEWLTAYNTRLETFNQYDCKNMSADLSVINPAETFTMLGAYKGHITQDYYWVFQCGKNTHLTVFFSNDEEQVKCLDINGSGFDQEVNVVRFYIDASVFYREINGQRTAVITLPFKNGYSINAFGHLLCKGKGHFSLVDQQCDVLNKTFLVKEYENIQEMA
jgi:hypothetical protein